MPLTKAQIIEIQESAKYNYMRRLKEQEEKKAHAKNVAEKIAEATQSVKKGK